MYILQFDSNVMAKEMRTLLSRFGRVLTKCVPVALLVALASANASCSHTVGSTSVRIVDSIRHYLPATMGQDMTIKFEIDNIGKEPLIIDDIQPSWGASDIDEKTAKEPGKGSDFGIIPPGKKQVFYLRYNTSLNSGNTEHIVRIYGNIVPNGVAYLKFDVNIVPPTVSSLDYEENYFEKEAEKELIQGLIDGKMSERRYYTKDEENVY